MGFFKTSSSNYGAIARSQCRFARDALTKCKEELFGISIDDKYPPPRRGEGDCGDVEWEFKKCVAFAVDERNARILYGDGEGGKKFKREEKYEA
eukprot:CAMPEP_0118639594 /NCGR_PEP_ID=MMETSP0785-20121206/4304_1 /TAXON_ID=91992 /ORGANISM="Bolidomonas pacifica, Strain CCMP 1866" /LENGTH=93 /DNA_ID=CAMNT_0006530927 /DNA_START=168 /DNA_END=445 /DNA_ORIENTATION=+